MIDRQPAHPALLADLERYWQSLRPGPGLPARTAVDPVGLAAALPHTFIAERIAPGIARVRVAGQRINDYMGMDLRGMPICSLFGGPARDVFQGWLEQVFALPAVVDLPLQSGWALGRPRLTGRMILLPLLDAEGRVTRALGALRTDGTLGRLPRAFTIPDDTTVRLVNVADLPPGPLPRLRSERPFLRLVVSNV
jgi:hypothetical protein